VTTERWSRRITVFALVTGLWSRTPSNFGSLDPEPKFFEWCSRSLKFEFPFNRHTLWSKPIVQIIQCFLVFNRPNHSGVGAKNFRCLVLVSDPEIWVPAPQPCLVICVSMFMLQSFVTLEFHLKAPELLNLLPCFAADLRGALTWVSRNRTPRF